MKTKRKKNFGAISPTDSRLYRLSHTPQIATPLYVDVLSYHVKANKITRPFYKTKGYIASSRKIICFIKNIYFKTEQV